MADAVTTEADRLRFDRNEWKEIARKLFDALPDPTKLAMAAEAFDVLQDKYGLWGGKDGDHSQQSRDHERESVCALQKA